MLSSDRESLVALFDTRTSAESAMNQLRSAGLDGLQLEMLVPGEQERAAELGQVNAAEVGKDVAAGAGIGAAAGGVSAAAVAAGVTLLATAPVVAALVGAGLGAGAGAIGGAAASASLRRPQLAAMVGEAVERGYFALMVGVTSEGDALRAQDLLEQSASVKVIDRHGGQHAG